MNLVIAGTFDLDKPRVRLLLEAAKQIEPNCRVLHKEVWDGVADKSQLRGLLPIIGRLLQLLLAYPGLLWKLLSVPRKPVVLVPYMGLTDVLVFWPLVRIKGGVLVWDVFLSTWDTAVRDRRMLPERSLRSRLLYGLEWFAGRLAERILIDTKAHAESFASLYSLPDGKVQAVPVGAELSLFDRRCQRAPDWDGHRPLRLLFYGQFIPLHGLDTLLDAMQLLAQRPNAPAIELQLVGTGQEAARIDQRLASLQSSPGRLTIERLQWLAYGQLPATIAAADICCGIFGDSIKAGCVIPNKVYQVLAVGQPLVTADTPAIRELLQPTAAVALVKPACPKDLADAIQSLAKRIRETPEQVQLACTAMPAVGVSDIAKFLATLLRPPGAVCNSGTHHD